MEPSLTVNGRSLGLGDVGGHVTLLEWLRFAGLTGTKEGCAEGECGACAVLVARPDGDGTRWTAINSCLVPAAGLDNQEIVTAEGLAGPDGLHPVQREMAERGGSQCGFCTPGFICSMAAEYYRADRRPTAGHRAERAAEAEPNSSGAAAQRSIDGNEDPAADPTVPDPTSPGQAPDHEHGPNGFDLHALSGNLCRCTGYRPIRDAAYALGQPTGVDPLFARLGRPAPPPATTEVFNGLGDYRRPAHLGEALSLLAEHPDARLVAGSTDWGVELNIRHARADLTIGIDRLPELRELTVGSDCIDIGAALTLSEIEHGLAGRVPLLAQLFPQFASRLIRNGATFGGNLGTASPIGDSPPALLALRASLVLASAAGEREVPLAEYFTGYRRTVKHADELIRTVRIPLPLAPISAFHKISKRRFDDISSVAVAFALRLENADKPTVDEITIGLGGVAAMPIRGTATEAALTGQPWNQETVDRAAEILIGEATPISDHRASAAYRSAMLGAALRKFYAENPGTTTQEA
ncbi:xanthine dehydrogenase small subunit [Nakamurella sp. GG22]